MMNERIPCCIPFCRRTAARETFPDSTEIICGRHYRLADSRLRRRLAKVRRWARRTNDPVNQGRAANLDWRIWDRIKRQAVERAFGL